MQPMTSRVQLSIVSSRSFKLAPVLSQQVFFVSSWLVCQNMATISSNCKHFHKALSKTWFCVITGTENAHVAYLSAALADEKVYLPATLTASVCRSALFLFSCSIQHCHLVAQKVNILITHWFSINENWSIDLNLLKFDAEYQFAKCLAVSVTVLLWGWYVI